MTRFTAKHLHPPRDDAAKLDYLYSAQQIRDLLGVYCRAQDRCDLDLILSVFHEDAVDDHGGLFEGSIRDFFGFVIDILERCERTSHHLGQILVDIQGDVAWSETYAIAFHRYDRDGLSWDSTWHARMLDRFERRAGQWKIARRRVIYDYAVDQPTSQSWAPGLLSAPTDLGTRNSTDPSEHW